MQLWLVRHARARAATYDEHDIDRPLTAEGRQTAGRLGRWIADTKLSPPERILVSPARRTRETAECLLAQWSGPEPVVAKDLWEALEEDLIHILQQQAEQCERLMLIGHNPGLEWLVAWLTSERLRLGMQPATLAIVETPVPIGPGVGRNIELVQPSDLT